MKRNLKVKVVESRNNETAEGKDTASVSFFYQELRFTGDSDYQTGKVSASRSFSDN